MSRVFPAVRIVTQHRVLAELEELAFSSIDHYTFDDDGHVILAVGAPPRAIRAVKCVKPSTGLNHNAVDYRRGETIFSQGDACDTVVYLQRGAVKLSVHSTAGREAVVAMLGSGQFFGEGSLAGQPSRMASATALTDSTVLVIDQEEMSRGLHMHHRFSDCFLTHMLARHIRIEEDLIDQLFNSSEKRLARALLRLARYGKQHEPERVVTKISQENLADMIGTTRSRVNFFMNKFKKLGFIDYTGEVTSDLTINHSLLSVVLHDEPRN